jgi:hypothetical protein
MLYLFAGDDAKSKIINYEKFVNSIPAGRDKLFVSRNNFNKMQIESLYSGSGLFTKESAIIFESILDYEDQREFLLDKLEQMGESANTFVFLESKLTKPVLDEFKKVGPKHTKLNIFELPKAKKERFDNFLVANAFAQKDKLNMWIYFRQAMDLGVGMEEIIGVPFWKIKDMILKRNFSKFTEPELKKIASKISYLLPEARHEGRDAEAAFEQFLLEVV